MHYTEFSQKIKTKYPEYQNMDDRELAQKIVAKYPQYNDITFDEQPKVVNQPKQSVQQQNIQPTNQELTIEQPSTTQLTGGVEKSSMWTKDENGNEYLIDSETGKRIDNNMEIRNPDKKIELKNFKDIWELGTNKAKQEQYKRQQAGEAILRGQRFAKDHPILEGIAKDYLPGYRATQWSNEFDRTHDKNSVNAISKQIAQAGLNLIPSANLASAYATGGMGNLAKAGGIDGLVQGITSAIGDVSTGQAKPSELITRPLLYSAGGGAGGAAINKVLPNASKTVNTVNDVFIPGVNGTDKVTQEIVEGIIPGLRRKRIQARRNTSLADRMTPEQLERATTPKVEPSNYGVADIDSNANKIIGEQIFNNLDTEVNLLNDYKKFHSDLTKKYGSIDKLREQALADAPKEEWGEITEALRDYRKLLEDEITLKDAYYVSTNIKNSVTRDTPIVQNIWGNTKDVKQVKQINKENEALQNINKNLKSHLEENKQKYILNNEPSIGNFYDTHNKFIEIEPPIYNGERSINGVLKYLGSTDNKIAEIKTPIEKVKITRGDAKHLIEDNEPERANFINRFLKTLETPNLIINSSRNKQNYNYYIKLFQKQDNSKSAHLQIVKIAPDGSFYVTNHHLNNSLFKNLIKNGQIKYDLSDLSAMQKNASDNNIITNSVQNFNPSQETNNIKLSKLNQSDLGKEANSQATYDVLHNKDLINQASVEANKEGAFGNLLGRTLNPREEMSALDFETGRQLATKLLQEGKTQDGLNLIEGLANKASKAGQAVQALSLWSKVTPEGAILQAEKLINNYNKNASKKLPKLTEQQAQDILKLQENIANQTDDRARDIATAQLLKYQAELIPQSAWQKAKTLRNISLLLNPKTLVRNIVGNGAFALNEVSAKALADFIDTGLSMVTKTKTRSMPKLNAMWQGLKQGTKEGIEDVNLGIDTRGGIGARYDLPNTRSFKSGVLGQLEKALDYGLRVPDRTFYQGVYNESVANQLAAKGLKEVTPEIAERARQEALEAVFQNDGKISNTVLGLRRALNKIGNKDFGLGDWLIPYAQTPANLVQQGINYSPLGFIKAALNKGDQRQASLDIARALIGSGLMGGGYALAKNGIGQGAVDDYQTKKNLEAEGIRPFTINGVSFNQIQPNAVPLTAGMALANPSSKGALNDALETITDLSMLDSLKQFNKDRENYGTVNAGLRQLAGLPSQFVGTGVNQINAFIDPYQRETYDPNIAKQGLNKLMAKTPGLSYALPKATDVKGEEIKKYADSPNTLAKINDVFLNPVFINKKKNNPVMQEVIRLNSDANKTLLPIAEKKLKFTKADGTEFNKTLTSKEYVAYKNKLGKEVYDNLAELMNTEFYQNADDLQKANLINKLQKDVKDRVQQDIFNKASKKDKPKISKYERKKKQYLNKQLKNFIDDNYGEE